MKPTEVRIREARPEDDARVGDLLVDAFVTAYARLMPDVRVTEERKADLRDVASKRALAPVFVAELDGLVVGTIAVFPPGSARSEGWIPGSADLRHLAVDPALHGQGISAPLIEAAEERAKEWGANVMCLHVRRGATGVARLYQRRGYIRAAQGDIDYPSVYLEAYFKPLAPSSRNQSKTTVLFA